MMGRMGDNDTVQIQTWVTMDSVAHMWYGSFDFFVGPFAFIMTGQLNRGRQEIVGI